MKEVPLRNKQENNREYAYRSIKTLIMSLDLEPGQPILESELANLLNLSRTPIREVITKLKEEYLVDVIPQVGTYVSRIEPKLVEEALFSRIILERKVLELACKSFPTEILNSIKNNLNLQYNILEQGDAKNKFHFLDLDFHFYLFKGVHKERVWEMINRLSTHYNRVRLLTEIKTKSNHELLFHQHKIMIDLLENKNDHELKKLVLKHIKTPLKEWQELYSEGSIYSHYFEKNSEMPYF